MTLEEIRSVWSFLMNFRPSDNTATEPKDAVKQTMLDKAEACLNYVRQVTWGSATASYVVNDDGRQVQIAISIQCFEATKAPEPAPVANSATAEMPAWWKASRLGLFPWRKPE